jgi:hypothetical protein
MASPEVERPSPVAWPPLLLAVALGAAIVLGRLYPDQDAFVFAGLEPSTGPGAVLSVATLLDRLDALESSPARGYTDWNKRSAGGWSKARLE